MLPWWGGLLNGRTVPGWEQWKPIAWDFESKVGQSQSPHCRAWYPAGRKTNEKPNQSSLFCSSMIPIREIDADSIQVARPWLSCHVTAYGLKPVSQGKENRWKEEESPPEVLTSSHLLLSERGQVQTTGTQKKDRRWQKERLVSFLQGQPGCKPFSTPYLVWKKNLVWVNGLLWARSVHPMWQVWGPLTLVTMLHRQSCRQNRY